MINQKKGLKNKTPLRVIKDFGVLPKKRMGQNFLIDNNYLDKIALEASSLSKDKSIIFEIGAGTGNLTAKLLEKDFSHVCAIEKDEDLIDILKKLQEDYDNLAVYHSDVVKFHFEEETHKLKSEKYILCGNIPYSLTSSIMFTCLDHCSSLLGALFLIQKEVAQRIAAKPNCKQYGSLSVLLQSRFTVNIVSHVPKSVFFPVPKVDSSIIKLTPKKNSALPNVDWALFKKTVKAAFNQRRKTLRNSLGTNVDNITELLEGLSINPKLRAENLSVDDYVNITKAIKNSPY